LSKDSHEVRVKRITDRVGTRLWRQYNCIYLEFI
jgi:hypothetical protein